MIKKILIFAGLILFTSVYAQQTHTVVKGDNPYSISKKYGISLQDLYQLNPSVKEGVLSLGQILVIKKSNSTPTTTSTSSINNPKNLGQIILQPKQTIYGITKQYHISEADLRKLNPDLDNSMKIGDKITLPLLLIKKYGADQQIVVDNPIKEPVVETEKPTIIKENTTPSNPSKSSQDDYLTYKVQSGDTIFGIVSQFGVSLDELLLLNPQLSSGLKTGMVLRIKKNETSYIKKSGGALNVALILPFGYESGDAKYKTMSLDFLAGAKLAIERNAKRGQKLNIKVIDAGSDTTFKNSLVQIDKQNTDLIIGPFFKQSVVEVLNYVKEEKIPVVAPFANSDDLFGYSNLIMTETKDEVYVDKIVKEVKTNFTNQKIYIVSGKDKTNAMALQNALQKSLTNPIIVMVSTSSEIQLDQNMMTGQAAPITAILASKENEQGNDFTNKMIELSKMVTGIRAFSMFYFPKFEDKVDELSQVNLVYLMDRKINTEGSFEKEILADYKKKYCKTPNKYSVIGFDLVNDMLSRENEKGEIFKQIEKTQTQLATKFEFVKTQSNGAYINTGCRVIRLEP